MARRSWSTANFFRYASGVITAAPVTIACWAKTSITGSAQIMGGLFTSGSAANRNNFQIRLNNTEAVVAASSSATGESNAATSTTITAGTWFHACGVFASATSRAAYLNGGGKVTETTSRVPSGIDRTSVGVGDGSSALNPFAPAGTGDIAEVAIWDIDLTDAEVLLLSKGVSPLLVRPGNLVGYWPLVGNTSPEINYLSSAAVLSMQGTVTTAAHPRVIMPRRLKTGRTFAAAAAADLPFGITHLGAPRTVPSHSRQDHAKSHFLGLIGKDQFFGAPGQGPTYDYPNPRISPRSPSLHSWTFAFDPATLALVDQAPFKNQNWSNPQLPLSVNRTWTFSLGPEALLSPFTPTYWPNPSIRIGPQADTHLSSLLTTTLVATRPFQTPFWPFPPPRPVVVTYHWGNNLIGTLLATEPPLSAAVLPVFGTWTVKVIDETPTLKVVSSIAADASVAGFAATPLKVFASESIAPLRVRTRYTTP